uniref:Uncharacterized protein n=1 Tax=Aeromonas salmonicida subsp. salmonicida TaxID=29491 RepID=A0A1I9S258_AERSS|nr:putative hypothetical protein [Aeromonas salmonicida subsp. salmonicida]
MSPGAAAGLHRCAAAPWPCGPVRRPGPQDGGSRGGASCSAATARGALPAGDVADLGHRWGATGPCPRARRRGHHLVGGPSGGGDRGPGALQCCNSSVHLAGQQPLPLPSGAGSDSVGTCCWAMAMSPGWTADGGHHLVGNPVRRPGSQGRVIAGRSALQCCNRSRHPAGRQPQPLPGGARSVRWACCWAMAMAISPDGTADRGHHLVGGALDGLVPRSALQCCNRSRYPAGLQPQPLPGGARSDLAGVLLGHGDGHVPGRDGRQRPSPAGRRARRPGSQVRAAVLQPLEVPRWPAAPASPWWCEIRSGGRAAGPWPSARAGRQTGPSPGWRPAPAAWPPGTGDRGQE